MKPFPTLARCLAMLCLAVVVPLGCGTPEDGTHAGIDDVSPQGQTVVFWHTHAGSRGEALLDLVDLFNHTNPHGITVRGRHVGNHKQIYHEMELGIEGGPLPQLVEAYRNQVQTYQQAGAVVDLTPYLTSTLWGFTEAELSDFIPDFLEQDQVDGAQLALLPNRSMEVVYYNRDWLQELGYDEPPADWDEFAAMCRAAAAKPFSGSTGSGSTGIAYERDASRLTSIIYSLGGDVMNADMTAYTYRTPEARRALTLIRDLADEGAARLVDDNVDLGIFARGEALFAQRSSAGAPQVAAGVAQGAGFTWGVAGIPSDQPTPVENVYGASLAVVRSTPEQQLAAWLFIKWFTEPEQQDRWASASGYFPVRRSVASRLTSGFRVAYNLLQYGKPEPTVSGYEPVRALVVETMQKVVEGKTDIEAALADLETDANGTLQAQP